MQNLKRLTVEQKEIINNAISILYTCEDRLGNFNEKEVIKCNNKFYRIFAINKHIKEFTEV